MKFKGKYQKIKKIKSGAYGMLFEVSEINNEKEHFALKMMAKELYKEAGSYSGFIMHDFGASLQIYALNKIDSHRDLAIQSNLTYIDLGTCLD